MRFFSGMRSGEKKKSAAQESFKKQMNGNKAGMPEQKKTPAEEFQEMLDSRMMKMMKDYSEGKKKGMIALKGVKQDSADDIPKKVSPNAKKMFEVLARQKLMNDMKKQRKQEQNWQHEQKKLKKQEAYVKQQETYQVELREKEYHAQQEQWANPSSSGGGSYFWGK